MKDLRNAQEAAAVAQAAVNAGLEGLEAERARMAQVSQEAHARAEAAIRERDSLIAERDVLTTARDALAAELAAARQTAIATEGAGDSRLKTLEADRTRIELAWKDAEARAEEALRQRDETAKAMRMLQLKVVGRKAGAKYRDVELTAQLDASSPPSEQAVRRAKRYTFPTEIEIRLDDDVGQLFDLSVGGAQVLCSKQPEVNHLVNLSLLSDEAHVSCEGRIVWAWLEPHSQGRKLRYRAGLFFTKVDEAAVEDFIARHLRE
jgi:hypothetical protein